MRGAPLAAAGLCSPHAPPPPNRSSTALQPAVVTARASEVSSGRTGLSSAEVFASAGERAREAAVAMAEATGVKVFCRFRPFNRRETELGGDESGFLKLGETSIEINDPAGGGARPKGTVAPRKQDADDQAQGFLLHSLSAPQAALRTIEARRGARSEAASSGRAGASRSRGRPARGHR